MSSIFQTGTYSLTLRCSNCGQSKTYSIAKGTSFSQVSCSNCGCSGLHKAPGYQL